MPRQAAISDCEIAWNVAPYWAVFALKVSSPFLAFDNPSSFAEGSWDDTGGDDSADPVRAFSKWQRDQTDRAGAWDRAGYGPQYAALRRDGV
jgi:hypothetical protein